VVSVGKACVSKLEPSFSPGCTASGSTRTLFGTPVFWFIGPATRLYKALIAALSGLSAVVTGRKLWFHDLQKEYSPFTYQWTYGASPTIYKGKLYIQVLRRDEPVHGRGNSNGQNDSYLLALEPATGKELWKHSRPTQAHAESQEAYSTPIPFFDGGREEILIAGGDDITGHDPADGTELWRWGTWNPSRIGHWRLVPSPVSGGGVVLACAPKGSPVYAFKAGAKGKQDDSVLAWKAPAER